MVVFSSSRPCLVRAAAERVPVDAPSGPYLPCFYAASKLEPDLSSAEAREAKSSLLRSRLRVLLAPWRPRLTVPFFQHKVQVSWVKPKAYFSAPFYRHRVTGPVSLVSFSVLRPRASCPPVLSPPPRVQGLADSQADPFPASVCILSIRFSWSPPTSSIPPDSEFHPPPYFRPWVSLAACNVAPEYCHCL